MKKTLLFLLITLSTEVNALLPPYYQNAKEITTILNDPTIAGKITSGRFIQSIVKTEEGYIITARECKLNVKVINLPAQNGLVGPVDFKIDSGDLVCEKK